MRNAWLTLHAGGGGVVVCHIRVDAVTAVCVADAGCYVYDGSGEPWQVAESAEAVLGMITALDWATNDAER